MKHEYNILTNDGHCKDTVANMAIKNIDRDQRKKERNFTKRIFKRIAKHFDAFGYILCSISVISKKTGQLYKFGRNDEKKY